MPPLTSEQGHIFYPTQITQDKGLGLTRIPLYRFFRLTQIPQISLIFAFDDAKSHRGSPQPRSLRLTQIQRDSTKKICANLWQKKTPI